MKNKILNSIISIVLVMMAIPVEAQNYLKLYFKDGHTERHFMHLVQNISATKYDLEGNLHSDYQMQQIVMADTTYSYYLADIDSMAFAKVDEEQVKARVETVQSSLESILQQCSNVADVALHLNEISEIDGVENIYRDGEDIVIQIRDWFDIVFCHQPAPAISVPYTSALTKKKSMRKVPTAKNGLPLEVTIGFQMESDKTFDTSKRYIETLRDDFSAMGYNTSYFSGAELDLDFFYRRMFLSNILLIDTHGGKGPLKKKPYLYTGIEASPSWTTILDVPKYTGLNNIDRDDISFSCCEHSDALIGSKFFLILREDFIRKSPYRFTSPGPHIVYVAACSSLKGNNTLVRGDGQEVYGDDSFAQVFFDKGADVYLGYNEGTTYAGFAAQYFFDHMLHGASVQKAYEELLPLYKYERDREKAYLVDLYNENSDNPKGIFITNTHTTEKADQEWQSDFNSNGVVKLNGETFVSSANHSALHYAEEIDFKDCYGYLDFGFRVASQPNVDILSDFETVNSDDANFTDTNTGEVAFSASFKPTPGTTYYYRAFTHDGKNYNWGEEHSFTVEKGNIPVGYTSCPDDNHPHMIDLGLPSGTLWACCNVGASKPEEKGGYYAWGETDVTDGNYKYSEYINRYTTNWIDIGTDIAGTEYDAATANWGTPWYMPSKEQIDELRNGCSQNSFRENGYRFVQFTGANGGTILFPAQNYWSSTGFSGKSSAYANYLEISSYGIVSAGSIIRSAGLCIRPVCTP